MWTTGGTFEDTTDENNINEAIEAYGRVVFFVNLDLNYLTEIKFMKRSLK